MGCRNIEFSAEKSQQRLERYLRVFNPELLDRILAFALYLLGRKTPGGGWPGGYAGGFGQNHAADDPEGRFSGTP